VYSLEIRPQLDKKLAKLYKKDRAQYERVMHKVEEILQNPQHYKNLRAPLQNWKRVHIAKHFILTFSVDEKRKTVILEDYEHHDKIYKH
jgi:YafQ family addiction module toxin component